MGPVLCLYSTSFFRIPYNREKLGQPLGIGYSYGAIVNRFYEIAPEDVAGTSRHSGGIVGVPTRMVGVPVV